MSRRIGVTLIVLLLLSALGIAVGAPRLVLRRTETAMRQNGVEGAVRIEGRRLVLDGIAVRRSGLVLTCDRIAVDIALVDSIRQRGPSLRSVSAGTCRVTGRPTRGADANLDAPTTEAGTRLDEVRRHLPDDLALERLDVDVRVGPVPIRGRLDDVTVSGPGRVGSASWSGDRPLAWETTLQLELDEGGASVAPAQPLLLWGWTLAFERVRVGTDGAVRVESIAVDAPRGLTAHAETAEYHAETLTLSGVRGRASAAVPQPEPAEGDAEVTVAGEALPVPPADEDAGPHAPPPAWATLALTALSHVPSDHARARRRLDTTLALLPIGIELRDAVFDDVPGCGHVVIEQARVDATGIASELSCGGWRLSATVPRDPQSALTFSMEGFDLAALPGDSGGRADLRVELVPRDGGLAATVDGRVADARFAHAAIAPAPIVGLEAAVHVEAAVAEAESAAEDGRATLHVRTQLEVDGIRLDATLSAVPTDGTWEVAAEGGVTEATPCEAMWHAIPDAMVPSLREAGVTFTGSARPRLRATYTAGDPESFDMRQDGFMGDCAIEDIGAPYDVRELLSDTFVHTVEDGVSAPVEVGPATEAWVPLDALPSYVPALMWLSEEIGFFRNPGFSLMLMRRAVRIDLREGRYVYGGSTVSQQLVKNLYFTRDKTLSRKLEEAIVVWALEQWVPKERILELYVNCIEFGTDVWGIRAAAHHYFGLDPWALTPLEAAFLAALKPAPWQGERYRLRGSTPDTGWWLERIGVLLQRLVDEGPYVTQAEVDGYAGRLVTFPAGPDEPERPWERTLRPKGATTENLRQARERLGLSTVESSP